MKKDKKNNKENKSKLIILTIVHGIAYVLSILAIFFIVLMSFNACSNTEKALVKDNDIHLSLEKHKNNAISYQSYNNSLSYSFRNGSYMVKLTDVVAYQASYSVSLGSTMAIVVRDSNDSIHALDETWTVSFNLHSPVLADDTIRFETPNWTRVYKPNFSTGRFYIDYYYAPENYTYEEIYLPVNLGYESPNYDNFVNDMAKYFLYLPYYDYILDSSWNPSALVPNLKYDSIFAMYNRQNPEGLNGVLEDNAVYGTSFHILEDTIFGINGYLYTDLLFHTQTPSGARFHIYKNNYNDFVDVYDSGIVYFIDFVYAYNRLTERSVIIYETSYEDNENVYSIYSFESGFRNNVLNKIRLFDRHLAYQTIKGYTNGNILNVNGYAVVNGTLSDGTQIFDSLGAVFDLFSLTFSKMGSFFNISIGAGITLGALFLMPLVVYLIFAIINLFKR